VPKQHLAEAENCDFKREKKFMNNIIVTTNQHRTMRRSTFLVAILAVLTVFALDASAQRIIGGRKLQLDDNTGRWIQLDNFNRTISIGNTAPPASSIFYVEGLNPTGVNPALTSPRGVLFAPMSTANRNAIVTPADGLLIYNTDSHGYQFYNTAAASWQDVGSGWSLTGNALGINGGGTAVGQSFIGTVNVKDFVIATNTGIIPTATGTGERIRVTSSGNIGINDPVANAGGTPFTPAVTFHVNGVPPTNTGDATPNIRANSLSLFPQMTPGLVLATDGIVMGNNAGDLRKYDVATVVGAVAWLRTGNTITDGNNIFGTLAGSTTTDINVQTNSVNAMTVLGSNQNVGINNAAPTYKLDVNGTFRSTGNSDVATNASTTNTFGSGGGVSTNTVGDAGLGIVTNYVGTVSGGGGIATNNIGLVSGGGGVATNNFGSVTGGGGVTLNFFGQAVGGGVANNKIGSTGVVTTDIVNTTTINDNFNANTSINTGTSTGAVAIATGASAGTVNIGSTTHTGLITIASNPAAATAILMNVGATTNNLALQNIAQDNTTLYVLGLNAGPNNGNVRTLSLAGLADEGVAFESNHFRLGSVTPGNVPITTIRTVRTTTGSLTFDNNNGAPNSNYIQMNNGGNNLTIGNNSSTNIINGGSNAINAIVAGNTITGQTGNTMTATTGNNAITATAGNNNISTPLAAGQNNLTANGATGQNNLTVANGSNNLTVSAGGSNNLTATGGTNNISGPTNVNTTGAFATNINTFAGAGAVTIGGATHTGAISIAANTASAITLNVTSTANNLIMNNILEDDATQYFLGLNAGPNSGSVRTIFSQNLADQGLTWLTESGVSKVRLGGTVVGQNPITVNRFVTINNGGTLNFDNSAGNNLLGFTPSVNTITIGTDALTTTEIRGATNINNNFNGTTNINTGSSTGSVAIETGAGAGTVNIGSATHAGALSLASNAAGSSITLNVVAAATNNLVLQNIATDATTTQFLTLTGSPSGNVRLRGMGSLADQGLIAQAEANDGGTTQVRLGVRTATDVAGTNALLEDRTVYLGGKTLNFSNSTPGAFLSLNNTLNTTTLGLAAVTANTVTGTSNTLTATTTNLLTGGTGNTMSATTGNNAITAVAAAGQNNITSTATGSNNISGPTNINTTVASATNINTFAGAGAVTIGGTTHTGAISIAANTASAITLNVTSTGNNLILNNILEDDATQYFLGLNAGPNNGNVRTINAQNLAEQGLTWTTESGVSKVRLGSLVRGFVAGGNPLLTNRFVNLSDGTTGRTLVFGGFANTAGTDLLTLNAGAGVNSIGIIGTTSINALGTASTSIGTVNGAVNIGGAASAITIQGAPININNTGGDNGTVNIGNSGIGGPVNVFLSGINDFTVDLGTVNSSDFIIHDLNNTVPVGPDIMVIDGSDIVHRLSPGNIAEQGLTFNNEAGVTKLRLGGLANTDNPFLANRFVNLDVFTVNYTGNGGANTIVTIDGQPTNPNVMTINNPGPTNTALKINGNGGTGVVLDPVATGIVIDATAAGILFTGSQPTTGIDLSNGALNDGIIIDNATTTGITVGETLPGLTGMTIDATNDGLTVGANTAPAIGANINAVLTGIAIGNTTEPVFGLVSSGSLFGGVFEAGPTAGNVGVVVGLATSPDIGVDVTANNIGVNIGSFIAPTTGINVRAFITGVNIDNGSGLGSGLNIFNGGQSITTDGANTLGDGTGNDAFTVNAGSGSANINSNTAINLTGATGANIGLTTNTTGTISMSTADGDITLNQTGLGNVNIDPTGTGNINIGNVTMTGALNVGNIASIMNWNSQTINAPNIPTSATYDNILVIKTGQIMQLTGGIVTASNGIYLNGNDVRLGTNPLIEPTTITGTTFPFAVTTTDGGIDLSSAGTGAIGLSSSVSGPINIATTGTGAITLSSTSTGNIQLTATGGANVTTAVSGGGNAQIGVAGTGNANIATASGNVNISSVSGDINVSPATTGNLNIGNAGITGNLNLGRIPSTMNWNSQTINAPNIPASGGVFNRVLVMTAANQIQTALASSFLIGADNGLNVVAGIVKLGGPLTQNTLITGGTFSLGVTTTTGGIGFQTTGAGNIGIASTATGGAINISTAGAGAITLSSSSASNINLSSTSTGNIALSSTGGGSVNTTVTGAGGATMTTVDGNVNLSTSGTGNANLSTSGTGNVNISTTGAGTVRITPGANIGAAAAPNSTLQLSGSFAAPIRVDNNVTPTAGATDYTIIEQANVNVTLPAATAAITGRIYCIKNTNAAGGAIAIGAAGDLIDGVNANSPLVQNQAVIIQCAGAGAWYILSTQ
jgi:filamentous hemagglutinin